MYFINPPIYGIQIYNVPVRIRKYKEAAFLYTIVRKNIVSITGKGKLVGIEKEIATSIGYKNKQNLFRK